MPGAAEQLLPFALTGGLDHRMRGGMSAQLLPVGGRFHHHHVGLAQRPGPRKGQQAQVSGTGTDEGHGPEWQV